MTPTILETLTPLYRRGPSPARHPVSVEEFVPAMTAHWTKLGNVVSSELESIWTRFCTTLNSQVLQHGTHEAERWRVFPAELGSGKTEGLKLYASLLPRSTGTVFDEPHPGVLIIVRLKKQADEIADDINSWTACSDTAFAYHTDRKIAREELSRFPVLVVTHAAYELGLEALTRNKLDGIAKWGHLHKWGLEGRKLIVIDEALDLIREERATLKNLRLLRGVLPEHLQVAHKTAVKALDDTISTLSAFVDKKDRERKANAVTLPDLVDFTAPWDDLKTNTSWPSTLIFGDPDIPGSEEKAKRKFIRRLKLTLSGLQSLLERWHWYYDKLGDHTLTTSWFLLPDEGIRGAVILDATAPRNVLYKLFGERFDIVTVPSARTYHNVQHRYIYADVTGKESVIERADDIVREMITNLQAYYGPQNLPHRSVLFISHKDMKSAVMKWATDAGFKEVGFGHWGALDGLNTWSHFNTVVVLSQLHRDPATPINIFQAIFGPQSTAWLNNAKLRKWNEFPDVLAALDLSQLVVDNAQAINRSRSRRVVDERGNCKPVDVFSRLPRRGGSDILAGLALSMPGIRQREWKEFSSTRQGKLTPSYDEALIAQASNLPDGFTKAALVWSQLGISHAQRERLITKLKNPTDALAVRCADLGVAYTVERVGKTQVAYLYKTPTTEREE